MSATESSAPNETPHARTPDKGIPGVDYIGHGTSVCIVKDGRVLVGTRKGSHGAGTLQFPGGSVEPKDIGSRTGSKTGPKTDSETYSEETYLNCAVREVKEETGLVVTAIKLLATTYDVFSDKDDNKEWNTQFVLAEMNDPDAKPETIEPTKCEGWYWLSWDELKARNDLFLPLENLFKKKPNIEDECQTELAQHHASVAASAATGGEKTLQC